MKLNRPVRSPSSRSMRSRRGFTTPAVAVGLLVAMCGLALILDRMWLDAADLELTTAAEAAAISAASELATDDLFKPKPDVEQRLEAARNSGAFIASQNVVAGDAVVLNAEQDGDIRLGKLILDEETGLVRFEETSDGPTTAVVTAMRTRRTSNPVGLFVAGATGQPFGDIVSRVEASVDNRVRAVRAQQGTPVPALPIAIWWRDPSGRRLDTWQTQIEARKGPDQFGYDALGQRVYSSSDGIPEIVLRSQMGGQAATNNNMLVVDVGTGMNEESLLRQFTSGWSTDNLERFGGEILLTCANAGSLQASPELRHTDREALQALIGEPRICLLYDSVSAGNDQNLQANCVRLVAIRVLAVRDQSDGSCEVIAQPCVLKTKTAVLDVEAPYSTDSVVPVSPYATSSGSSGNPGNPSGNTVGNPFIYKLQLSH